jgi:hypothetical protein
MFDREPLKRDPKRRAQARKSGSARPWAHYVPCSLAVDEITAASRSTTDQAELLALDTELDEALDWLEKAHQAVEADANREASLEPARAKGRAAKVEAGRVNRKIWRAHERKIEGAMLVAKWNLGHLLRPKR